MDDKDWIDKEEFWDNEIDDDEDEDDYNGIDGNIDANNDETFDNVAEWNEDEHEEMIARDLMPLHANQRNNRNNSSNSTNNNTTITNNNNHSNLNSSRLDRQNHEFNPNNSRGSTNNHSNNSSSGRPVQHFALYAADLESTSGQNSNWSAAKAPLDNEDILAQLRQRSLQAQQQQPRSSTSNELSWQDALGTTQRMQLLQLQQQTQEQLRILSQSQLLIDQEQQRLQQMNDQRRLMQLRQQQQHQHQQQQQQPIGPDVLFAGRNQAIFNAGTRSDIHKPVAQPKVLTVDELERQLMSTSINQSLQQTPVRSQRSAEPSRRAGWSPFGSKDLFASDDPMLLSGALLDPNILQGLQPQTLTLEQQRMILEHQQKLLLQHQQLQQLALLKQQQQQQQRQQHQLNQQRQVQQQQQLQQQQQNTDPKLMSSSAQCFTVEELERQMLANRASKIRENDASKETQQVVPEATEKSLRPALVSKQQQQPQQQPNEGRQRHFQDRRNGERSDRFDRNNHHRESTDTREHHRERRENKNQRDHFRHHRKEPTIIPPQVQLGVIDKAKRMHSITAMHSDEFLQDRMPTSGDGFRFMRHSKVAGIKANHDGVLTDKERDWLTRIQEKIQADYDDNIDQDYYYLLYFNRSSMTDEASQKPSGPGVFDRRFIPRERLLYNNTSV